MAKIKIRNDNINLIDVELNMSSSLKKISKYSQSYIKKCFDTLYRFLLLIIKNIASQLSNF